MDKIMNIPFSHLGRNGTIKAEYLQNPGPDISGFNAILDLTFDVELCKLYPTVNAKIDTYDGTGYRKLMGWIQFVTRYDISDGITHTSSTIDAGALGNPFFAVGYPPELYDAPCYNLGGSDKLIWVAEAFLTTVPSRMNGHTVAFLAGFEWGCEEFDLDGNRCVDILPIKQIGGDAWNKHIDLLRSKFPSLTYIEC